ncbi:MAG TPA: hypothetical protein VHE54_10140 [Puia sp.]|nr:hypothetical protein [Puia sp.]
MKYLYPAALLVATLLSASCKKEIDYIGQHYNDASPYDIAKITWIQPWGDPDTLTFNYDKWGNPTTIIRPRPSTGTPNFEFRYDANHRLTDYIGTYTNHIVAEFWHRYIYNAHGLITTDSMYVFPAIVNGQIDHSVGDARASQLTYDRLGRIIKEVPAYGLYDSLVFSYDAAGNRTDEGPFDDKVNFHRTNKIWMFIDRDYSINNPFIATSYNKAWLPLHFSWITSEGFFASFLYQNYLQDATVTYTLAKKIP